MVASKKFAILNAKVIDGLYFPFSMEANYNDTMSIMNKPFTMCHELAHTHGYIFEDEANFLMDCEDLRRDPEGLEEYFNTLSPKPAPAPEPILPEIPEVPIPIEPVIQIFDEFGNPIG